jgi:hypothetical protein
MADGAYAVFIEGLSETMTDIDELPERVKRSAQIAVNYATKRARTAASRAMRDQIAWSASYLDGKLSIKLAQGGELEGQIGAVFRPTSLARFASGSKQAWKLAKQLHVGAGRFTSGNGKMLFVPLKRGSGPITEDNMNLGLAIRLKEGEKVNAKYRMKPFGKGLYLLYGPSSAQVLYTVAEDISPDVAEWLNGEFERQMNRTDNR